LDKRFQQPEYRKQLSSGKAGGFTVEAPKGAYSQPLFRNAHTKLYCGISISENLEIRRTDLSNFVSPKAKRGLQGFIVQSHLTWNIDQIWPEVERENNTLNGQDG
jgi:hypothetical protein